MNKSKRICLNMIVKNETPVLGRLFNSVKDIISYYIIVDTGSIDGTPGFIKDWMDSAGIPGEIYCHEWVNFAHNRNQALNYACQSNQADWVLFIDADEELAYTNPLFYDSLEPGISYCLEKHHHQLRYNLLILVDVRYTRWQWDGVIHEHLKLVEGTGKQDVITEAWIIYHEGEGVRSRGISAQQKYLNDVHLLETELKKDPQNERYRFYLAQSYYNAGEISKAYQHYLIRAAMKGWKEEKFVAQYRAGKIAIQLKRSYQEIAAILLEAYEMMPSRGTEPLFQLAMFCRKQNWYRQAYMFATTGAQIKYPLYSLFVEKDIYEWRILDELAVTAYKIGYYQEATVIFGKLSQIATPHTDAERIKNNLALATKKLALNSHS